MKKVDLSFEEGFHVVAGNSRAQAAVMTLAAGDSTGGADNRHDDSDQWLFVVSGTGEAIVDADTVALSPGTLLLIEAGEAHEIRAAGGEPLETLNLYVPPEY